MHRRPHTHRALVCVHHTAAHDYGRLSAGHVDGTLLVLRPRLLAAKLDGRGLRLQGGADALPGSLHVVDAHTDWHGRHRPVPFGRVGQRDVYRDRAQPLRWAAVDVGARGLLRHCDQLQSRGDFLQPDARRPQPLHGQQPVTARDAISTARLPAPAEAHWARGVGTARAQPSLGCTADRGDAGGAWGLAAPPLVPQECRARVPGAGGQQDGAAGLCSGRAARA
mmetsp:Transcript_15703/g.42543  ORF Transcript_15703/g.42543 Transcript_15703/m.42543 type:complete len:223 (+) Transcript_15703:834-1502(+)